MNKLIAGVALSAVLLSNTASSSEIIRICKVYKSLGEIVMLQRQKGKTIEEMIEIRDNFDNALGRKIIGSMIVPAYNVEKYVRQCIDSVLNIVPNDGAVEIIVVNDGSTDTTREILAEYNSEKRVRIFNNDNFGVSAARNFAIKSMVNILAFLMLMTTGKMFHGTIFLTSYKVIVTL